MLRLPGAPRLRYCKRKNGSVSDATDDQDRPDCLRRDLQLPVPLEVREHRLGFTHNKVRVPAGEFAADLARVRLGYAFSTKVTFNALVQYNAQDDELSANLRFNFIHRPGSDLFIVINEERGSSNSVWHLNTRAAVVKLTYLARI